MKAHAGHCAQPDAGVPLSEISSGSASAADTVLALVFCNVLYSSTHVKGSGPAMMLCTVGCCCGTKVLAKRILKLPENLIMLWGSVQLGVLGDMHCHTSGRITCPVLRLFHAYSADSNHYDLMRK